MIGHLRSLLALGPRLGWRYFWLTLRAARHPSLLPGVISSLDFEAARLSSSGRPRQAAACRSFAYRLRLGAFLSWYR